MKMENTWVNKCIYASLCSRNLRQMNTLDETLI
jgi:hypothetical protein